MYASFVYLPKQVAVCCHDCPPVPRCSMIIEQVQKVNILYDKEYIGYDLFISLNCFCIYLSMYKQFRLSYTTPLMCCIIWQYQEDIFHSHWLIIFSLFLVGKFVWYMSKDLEWNKYVYRGTTVFQCKRLVCGGQKFSNTGLGPLLWEFSVICLNREVVDLKCHCSYFCIIIVNNCFRVHFGNYGQSAFLD